LEKDSKFEHYCFGNSTLPMADSEIIVDIFNYCVEINANLLKERDIEINPTFDTTNRVDADVVM
jgi:hypothetical protein